MVGGLLKILLLAPCLAAAGFYGWAVTAAAALFFRPSSSCADQSPPVSILKSLCGWEPDLYENLASFCRQDYPRYQILLGVADEEDLSIPVVRRLLRDFPEKDIQLVVCRSRCGANPKVSNLIQMEPLARHPVLLLSDSDIRVGTDYLRSVVQPMEEASVGAVTCMSRSRTRGFASLLEALRISTEFCAGVLVARSLEGIRFGLGSTIAVKRSALEAIGGLRSIADFLADDFQLGALIAKAGYRVVLSAYVVEHVFPPMRLADILQRQIRWARGIRISRPWSYAGLLFTHGVAMSTLFLLSTAGSVAGWLVLGLTWLARGAMGFVVGAVCLKDEAARRYGWLIPLQDLLSFAVWCVCFFGDTIHWRGERFRLDARGRLLPLSLPLPAASASSQSLDAREQKVAVG